MALTVIIDTREQQPYTFSSSIQTVSCKLESGDYSILGYENRFSIERKSLEDYIKSITSERDRFYRELTRLQSYDYSCIVVEGNISELLDQSKIGNSIPSSIFGTTVSIIVDKRIPIFFCTDRQHAIYFVEKMLTMYYDHYCIVDSKKVVESIKDNLTNNTNKLIINDKSVENHDDKEKKSSGKQKTPRKRNNRASKQDLL